MAAARLGVEAKGSGGSNLRTSMTATGASGSTPFAAASE